MFPIFHPVLDFIIGVPLVYEAIAVLTQWIPEWRIPTISELVWDWLERKMYNTEQTHVGFAIWLLFWAVLGAHFFYDLWR